MYFCIIYVLYTYVFLHCKIIHICKYNKKIHMYHYAMRSSGV